MNIQHTLMIMAAGAGTLCLAQNSTAERSVPTDATRQNATALHRLVQELNSRSNTEATTNAESLAQRMSAFPDLSAMPQDVDSYIVMPNIPAMEQTLMPGQEPRCPVQSLAIGTSRGAERMMNTIGQLVALFMKDMHEIHPEQVWMAESGTPAMQQAITKAILEYRQRTLQHIISGLKGNGNGPIYVVMTMKSGEESRLHSIKAMMQQAAAERPHEFSYLEHNGMFGMRHTPQKEISPLPHMLAGDTKVLSREREELAQELRDYPMTVMCCIQGNRLVAVACDTPEEATPAATPQESLLNTPKGAALDCHLSKDILVGANLSPAMQQALSTASCIGGSRYMLAMAQAVFRDLSQQPGDYQNEFAQAAAAATTLMPLTRMGMPAEYRSPATLCLWSDGKLNLELTRDAGDVVCHPGHIRLSRMGSEPSFAVYFETTPWQLSGVPDLGESLHAVLQLGRGFICTGTPERANLLLATQELIRMRLAPIGNAMDNMRKSLGTDAALLMGTGSCPDNLQSMCGPLIPTIAYRTGILNRHSLRQAWAQTLNAASDAFDFLLPEEGSVLPPLNAEPTATGGMSYSLCSQGLNDSFCPGIVISGDSLILGSSSELNRRVAEQDTGTLPFSGMVFSLHMDPIAQMARSCAGRLAEQAEECPDDAVMAQQAHAAATRADFLEHLATKCHGIYAANRIANGQSTLRLEVQLKK